MSVLKDAPFTLGFQAEVVAKVRATNTIGWGAYSSLSSGGALIQRAPSQMVIPTVGTSTSAT